MVCVKNYETVSIFVKLTKRKPMDSFFPDTVYIEAYIEVIRGIISLEP